MEKAVEIMGEEIPRRAQMHYGYHGHVLTYPVAKGSLLNGEYYIFITVDVALILAVAAFKSRETWADTDWIQQGSKEALVEEFKTWNPPLKSILANMQTPNVWALFDHTPARTYFQSRPRICLVGDAAHASTPHQGAGAGMGVEDCYILGELLGEAKSVKELENVFQAYEEVRRPRSLKLVETSREAGMLYEFEGPEGDDMEAVERNIVTRMDWVWYHDITNDLERARAFRKAQTE
jgi:salicylate hydroxylase